MAHAAFTVVDIVPAIDEKVTCLAYYADYIYVGTVGGRIRLYRVSATSASSGRVDYSTDLIGADAGSGRGGAVTQLEALGGDVNLLLAVADGAISMLDLTTLKRRSPGALDAKNVAFVAVNRARAGSKAGGQKLCVVTTRKRLRLFVWSAGGAKQFLYKTELDVPELPRAVAYYGASLICGYSREYNIISEDGEHSVRDVTGLTAARPYIKGLPGDSVLIIQVRECRIALDLGR
jgi:hypothetical protein